MASSVRTLNTTHWGVGTTLSRKSLAPVAFTELCTQISAPGVQKETLARLIVQGELYDRSRLPRPASDGDRLSRALETVTPKRGAWPYFVASSLRNTDLPPTQGFVDNMMTKVIRPDDKDAWTRAEPLELSFIGEYKADSPPEKPYELQKQPKKNRYLLELLGEKTAQMYADNPNNAAGPQAPKLDIPMPGIGVSRRLGRRTTPNAMSSQPAFNGQGLTPLGRSNGPVRGRNGRPMNGNKKYTSPTGKSSIIAMKAIRAQHERRKITVVDAAELPAADDTLAARKAREEQRAKVKEEQLERKKAIEAYRKAKEDEQRKANREKKHLATKEYRYSQSQLEPQTYTSDNDEEDVPISDDESDYSPGTATKRANGERLDAPPSKRVRVPRRAEKVASATNARTGEDAFNARARLSDNPILHINEMERSLRGPRYDNIRGIPGVNGPISTSQTTSPTITTPRGNGNIPPYSIPTMPSAITTAPDLISNWKWEELPEEFKRAVGKEYRDRLPEKTQRDLFKFTTRKHDMNDIFEANEDRKEYVLHETDEYTIVIRCVKSEGNWHRVRYAES